MPIDFLCPIIAVHATGLTLVFASLAELAARIRFDMYDLRGPCLEGGRVGDHFGTTLQRTASLHHAKWMVLAPPADWIIRDDRGRAVPLRTLLDVREQARKAAAAHAGSGRVRGRLPAQKRQAAQHAAKLGLPIPGTGGRGSRMSNYLRHPRTQAENREVVAAAADRGEVPLIAAKIRVRNRLPTAWDDIHRSRESSWKRHRGTQWKAVGQGRRSGRPGLAETCPA